jgi:hypothetical protein
MGGDIQPRPIGSSQIPSDVPDRKPPKLTPDEQRDVLETLVDRLVHRGVTARIYLIGGAAAGFMYYPKGVARRVSGDIDSIYTSTEEVEEEAATMADILGLRLDWFDGRAGGFVPPTGEPPGETLIARGNVVVTVAPPRFLLAMKLRASRPGRDDEDIAVLTRHCGITTVAACEALVEEVYLGEEEIPERGYQLLNRVLGEYELEQATPPVVLPPADGAGTGRPA